MDIILNVVLSRLVDDNIFGFMEGKLEGEE